MAKLTLAVASLIYFLSCSVHASKCLKICMLSWMFSTRVYLIISTVVAAPGRDKRQNSLFGNCAPSCGNQIRLSDGCSGTLEVLSRGGRYGTATDRNFGVNEATVVCRQLGCLRDNIQPVRVNTREWVTHMYYAPISGMPYLQYLGVGGGIINTCNEKECVCHLRHSQLSTDMSRKIPTADLPPFSIICPRYARWDMATTYILNNAR